MSARLYQQAEQAYQVARQAADRAADRERNLRQAQQQYHAHREAHPELAAEHRAVMREEAWQRRVAARAVELERPAWSRDLGQRPATVKGGRAWDRAVGQVVEYRQRWWVDDAERALGPEPHGKDASLEQRQAHRHADRAIGRLRDLTGDRDPRPDRHQATGRSDPATTGATRPPRPRPRPRARRVAGGRATTMTTEATIRQTTIGRAAPGDYIRRTRRTPVGGCAEDTRLRGRKQGRLRSDKEVREMAPTQEPGDRQVLLHDGGRGFDQMLGKARHGEPGKVKPYREWVSGDELHQDSGQRHRVERVIDHKHQRYTERITDEAGNVVREVDEPLSDHRGRGAAKRPAAGP